MAKSKSEGRRILRDECCLGDYIDVPGAGIGYISAISNTDIMVEFDNETSKLLSLEWVEANCRQPSSGRKKSN